MGDPVRSHGRTAPTLSVRSDRRCGRRPTGTAWIAMPRQRPSELTHGDCAIEQRNSLPADPVGDRYVRAHGGPSVGRHHGDRDSPRDRTASRFRRLASGTPHVGARRAERWRVPMRRRTRPGAAPKHLRSGRTMRFRCPEPGGRYPTSGRPHRRRAGAHRAAAVSISAPQATGGALRRAARWRWRTLHPRRTRLAGASPAEAGARPRRSQSPPEAGAAAPTARQPHRRARSTPVSRPQRRG
jgi:hypothetical protein